MIQVAPKYEAPLHDVGMNVIATADAAQAGYVNTLTLTRMGLLTEQTDFSRDGAEAIIAEAARYDMQQVMQKVAELPSAERSRLSRLAEDDFKRQTGKAIRLDDDQPLIIWADCSVHVVCSDDVVLMGLRSNSGNELGKLVPGGYGWRNIAPDGAAYGLAENAALHLKRKLGLTVTGVQDVGVVRRTNQLEAYLGETVDGTRFVPHVTPLFSYVGAVRLDQPAEEILRECKLNDQSFGVVQAKVEDIEALVAGRHPVLEYSSSEAAVASLSISYAFYDRSGEVLMAGGYQPLGLDRYRRHMSSGIPKISSQNPDGSPASYPLEQFSTGLFVAADDMTGVGRNYLAEAVLALAKLGVAISPETARYGRDHSYIEPIVPPAMSDLITRNGTRPGQPGLG